METREYFEKVMQDYNQNRNGRSLRRYSCVPMVASDKVEREKENCLWQHFGKVHKAFALRVNLSFFNMAAR